MKKIFALIEHRQGVIRDISYELLTAGRDLSEKLGAELCAIIIGYELKDKIEIIKKLANRIIVIESKFLSNFNSEAYQIILSKLLKEEKPMVTLIGHTAFGMDLAPSLAAELNIPLVTDCIGIDFIDNKLLLTRQMYMGKINAEVECVEHEQYLLTLRQGAFPAKEAEISAKIVEYPSPIDKEPEYRRFIEYVEAEAGAIDITKADIIVSVGRGIKEEANIKLVEDFANSIGGVLGCSRPIVDAGWLPKERQVGSSGKTVKPKLYIAVGISGAFQHIMGMKDSETIIAINKDPNAPIFSEAHYGIVDDLFKVIPVLKEKIKEIKSNI